MMVPERVMVDRIIEACNVVRAEYNAKIQANHEAYMRELHSCRLDAAAQVAEARDALNQQWMDALERAGLNPVRIGQTVRIGPMKLW
jgi:hypothetical protein